jgi:hypothetical protein
VSLELYVRPRMPTHIAKMLAILATLPRLPMPSATNLAIFEHRERLAEALWRYSPKDTADHAAESKNRPPESDCACPCETQVG